MMKDYENKISGKGGIWPFLYHFFIIKRIRPSSNQYIHTRFFQSFSSREYGARDELRILFFNYSLYVLYATVPLLSIPPSLQ